MVQLEKLPNKEHWIITEDERWEVEESRVDGSKPLRHQESASFKGEDWVIRSESLEVYLGTRARKRSKRTNMKESTLVQSRCSGLGEKWRTWTARSSGEESSTQAGDRIQAGAECAQLRTKHRCQPHTHSKGGETGAQLHTAAETPECLTRHTEELSPCVNDDSYTRIEKVLYFQHTILQPGDRGVRQENKKSPSFTKCRKEKLKARAQA